MYDTQVRGALSRLLLQSKGVCSKRKRTSKLRFARCRIKCLPSRRDRQKSAEYRWFTAKQVLFRHLKIFLTLTRLRAACKNNMHPESQTLSGCILFHILAFVRFFSILKSSSAAIRVLATTPSFFGKQ